MVFVFPDFVMSIFSEKNLLLTCVKLMCVVCIVSATLAYLFGCKLTFFLDSVIVYKFSM